MEVSWHCYIAHCFCPQVHTGISKSGPYFVILTQAAVSMQLCWSAFQHMNNRQGRSKVLRSTGLLPCFTLSVFSASIQFKITQSFFCRGIVHQAQLLFSHCLLPLPQQCTHGLRLHDFKIRIVLKSGQTNPLQ